MSVAVQFSLNRMSAPRMPFADYVGLCRRLGVQAIEIRNDLPGIELVDGTPAERIKEATQAAGLEILTINALQRFEQFDATRAEEAVALAKYAAGCGAKALVMCPTNSVLDSRTAAERHVDYVAALKQLKPILDDHGVLGLVETLGFEECALRRKSDAVKGIYDAAAERHFKLVHDTFHHHLSGEDIFFPDLTGLVHISGVEDGTVPVSGMRDRHRVLVGCGDRLGNIRQLIALRERGYRGHISFEPFAEEIAQASDIEALLRESMAHVRIGVEAARLREAA
ncbi:TIM barrel protein [Trinickia caryophylli]|uniref:2-keto-myo-inositol isomerase n=1 Tax=Trinickia caryophylli TaxID=28094 RepID=A0A1X7D484_TRICW|nr:TIM barrel protein [Trinickia caryophylli]PMS12748.1 xylose isomerase [Trinickia caryophylli]TRX15155.1 TIM barrel protein [Trinickia caryophylli]WQE15019.1 TIM barrel protein [Trinickia caryophylli]SMF08609.1 2-keto-myo-inositol isomerase [Trinickia caryophylli]GLU31248.1 iolI protein [Trinickia caryophylli]